MSLATFVESHCARAGSCKLKDLLRAFKAKTGQHLGRSRAIAELTAAGYRVGEAAKVLTVAPLSLPLAWEVKDGQLVQV